MNATPYLHLLWKEYRAIRAFWLSLLLLVMGALWLTMALSSDAAFSLKMVYSLALGAPAFFALGAAGTAFALEQEEGTYEFLRAAPVSARQVLSSKLGLTFLATVAMFAVLVPIAWQISGGKLPEQQVLRGMLGLWLLAAIEAIAWGAFFSLLTARPLTAICLALVAMSTTVHILSWSSLHKSTKTFDLYLAAVPWRAALAGVLLAADVLLGLRWLNETEPVARSSWKSWHWPRFFRRSIAGAETNEQGAAQQLIDAPDRRAIRSRLFWQHWRQSARLMLLMGGLQVVLTFFALHGGMEDATQFALLAMATMAALAGACVFLPDQEKRNYRFFVEHNVPPRTVWLTRQLPWIAAVAISTFVACLFWLGLNLQAIIGGWVSLLSARQYYGAPLLSENFPLVPFLLVPAFITVSYAAGQWTSMFVRSGLLAGFFGLLLAGVLCGWVYLMTAWGIPWKLSVLPIPIVLMAATWMRAPDWVAENTRWSARLRAAAFVLVPATAVFFASINNRVHQWQDVPLSFDLAEYEAQMNAESRETADMYRRADELLAFDDEIRTTPLDKNRDPLALLLEASRRKSCTLDDPRTSIDDVGMKHAWSLINLILARARALEREGNLDEALDRYFDTLRVSSHWRQHQASRAVWYGGSGGMAYVEMILPRIVAWSMLPGQTPQRIKMAIERLSALDDSVLHLGDGLKSNYILVQHALRGSQTELAALFNNQPNPTAELLRLRLPWEKAREERLSKVSTNLSLQQVESLRETLADEKSCLYAVSSSSDYSRRDHYLSPPLFLSNYYWGMQAADELAEFEQRRRATLILLALVGYRLEHDKLPATLSELVDVYLPELPLDPYSGRDFLYFPDGLPRAATEIDAADLAEAQKRSRDMILGQPGIWSTGPNLVTQTLRSDGLQLTDELVPVPAPDVTYYVERGDYQYHRLPLYRALGTGRLFRLPILEAELRQWHSK